MTNFSQHPSSVRALHISRGCQPVWPSRPILRWTRVGFGGCSGQNLNWIHLLTVNFHPIWWSEAVVFPSRFKVFVAHQLLSGCDDVVDPPTELRPAYLIMALIVQSKVSCNSLLSLSQDFLSSFCSLLGCRSREIWAQDSGVFWHISAEFQFGSFYVDHDCFSSWLHLLCLFARWTFHFRGCCKLFLPLWMSICRLNPTVPTPC